MTTIQIEQDGSLLVDGKLVTPAEVAGITSTLTKAPIIGKLINDVTHNVAVKNVEKVVVYIAAALSTSNVFGTIPVPSSVKEWVLGASAFVLGMIHYTTPVK